VRFLFHPVIFHSQFSSFFPCTFKESHRSSSACLGFAASFYSFDSLATAILQRSACTRSSVNHTHAVRAVFCKSKERPMKNSRFFLSSFPPQISSLTHAPGRSCRKDRWIEAPAGNRAATCIFLHSLTQLMHPSTHPSLIHPWSVLKFCIPAPSAVPFLSRGRDRIDYRSIEANNLR